MKRFLRACLSLLAAALPALLAGEIGALLLDLRPARLVGSGLALCVGAALAVSRPRWLSPAGLAAALLASVLLLPPLRLGRLAARWGIVGYHAALSLLLACAALSCGAALSLLPKKRARQSSRSRS